ncbi:MAG: hypothetical protein ACI9OJ_000550 [Myxococcota bacterium]|jgi:hypothetical protein
MSRLMPLALVGCSLAMMAGCSSYATYVDSSDAALGRVVVYRNGIAYFERKAEVKGDKLILRVPHDKVDDFLKSLTVSDVNTRKPYPVSFPTRVATTDGMVDMVIQLPPNASKQVLLSYITESPAWKPSYRLVVNKEGKVRVQGWAIVDNTSGEDWNKVRLGVGSSSALSFRYDLRTVMQVHRETLRAKQQFAVAPPRGGSVHKDDNRHGRRVVGSLADTEIPRAADHPVMIAQGDAESEDRDTRADGSRGGARGKGRVQSKTATRVAAAAPGQAYRKQMKRKEAQVQKLAEKLKASRRTITIEGYSNKGERDGNQRALDRANTLRNTLIRQGVAPGQLLAKGNGWKNGKKAGVELVEVDEDEPTQGARTTRGGDPIGESHFESDSTMTVARGTSAMVAILNDDAEGEVVYLYDAEAKRGNSRYAFKAVRFKNPTDSTLESGPVTVYGETRFIGEGLSDPIPPHSTAFVPYALDRQVIVDRSGSTGDEISRLLTVQRGVVRAEVQHTKTTKLKVTNRQQLAARVFVRHSVRKGWKLTDSPAVYERLGESHLFEMALAPGETKELIVKEATPLTRLIDLRSESGMGLVRVFLQTPQTDKRFEEPMRGLLKMHAEMANIRQRIASQRERMEDYRARIDELHGQIVDLADVKAGGGKLMRHLKQKMVEISNRLQKSTIDVVELQQQLTLAKIRFQDGISELSLTRVAKAD